MQGNAPAPATLPFQGEPGAPRDLAALVKRKAAALGFDLCGIARAEPLDPARFDRWLERGWDGPAISYVRERRAERLDPSLLLPGARSVIAVAASYAPDLPEPAASEDLRVARYAQGRDYHNVVLKPVRKLAAWIRAELGGRVYCEVDTGAVLEKEWAQRAGIGWIGKNGCLIHPQLGSWLLLGALIVDLDLVPDTPHPDRCGDCALCIPACPTAAIVEPRYVEAQRCLAYHTIEHRGAIPEELARKADGRVFGCDACQEACPWNRRAPAGKLVALRARPEQRALPLLDTLRMTVEEAKARFTGTPLLRAGRDGLVRSALAVARRPLPPAARELLQGLLDDGADGVRAEARRALSETAGG